MKKILMILSLSIIFISSNHAMEMENEKKDAVITINSAGDSTVDFLVPYTREKDKPLSRNGKIITGVYTTACGAATTASVLGADYGATILAHHLGFSGSETIVFGICSCAVTLIAGLVASFGGYRCIRPCLPHKPNNYDDDKTIEDK